MKIFAVLLPILLAVSVATAAKQKPGKGHGRGHERVVVESRTFHERDRGMILDYWHGHPGRGDDLPPGIVKQLRRNKRLPPGLEKKLIAFPPELHERLYAVPAGYERGFVGHFAIVWNPRTRIIVDVLAVGSR